MNMATARQGGIQTRPYNCEVGKEKLACAGKNGLGVAASRLLPPSGVVLSVLDWEPGV